MGCVNGKAAAICSYPMCVFSDLSIWWFVYYLFVLIIPR